MGLPRMGARMSDRGSGRALHREAAGSGVLLAALALGAALGAAAKLIGTLGRTFGDAGVPLVLLGMGTAVWVTVGFLVARRCAKGRTLLDGTVWAGTAMAVYLSTWLLAYTLVFGLQQDGGFAAAWLNERLYFVLAPAASGVVGFIAAASWRNDWLGDAAVIAPVAWSLPEAVLASSFGWQHLLLAGVPAIVLASVPMATARRRVNKAVAAGTVLLGGVIALVLLRVVSGGKI